jgi:hypothetical protein
LQGLANGAPNGLAALTISGPVPPDVPSQSDAGSFVRGATYSLATVVNITIGAGEIFTINGSINATSTTPEEVVPEPATWASAGIGVLLMAGFGLRRKALARRLAA